MTMLRFTQQTAASSSTVWDLLADFENIDFFNPNLSRSFLLTKDAEIGVGTKRQCDLSDGKNFIQEEILEWQPGEYYLIDIYNGTMPVKNAKTKLGVIPSAQGGSQVYMEFSYDPKFGPIGKVMDILMMRRMMSGLLQKVVDGLAEKANEAENKVSLAA